MFTVPGRLDVRRLARLVAAVVALVLALTVAGVTAASATPAPPAGTGVGSDTGGTGNVWGGRGIPVPPLPTVVSPSS